MLNVVCVKHGNFYGPEYVNRLYAMVARNLSAGTEGRFICYTEDATGIDNAVHIRPLPGDVEGWWNKLYLFERNQFQLGERVLYLDLDTVIVGPLDEITKWDGQFAVLKDFYRGEGVAGTAALQSSVMAWEAGFDEGLIWDAWCNTGRPILDGGDQEWIEEGVFCHQLPVTLWQNAFPGAFVSYKQSCIPYPPESACIVVFHGEPRPHNCGRKWVEDLWTENDTPGFHLALEQNTHLSQVRAQSASSALRELPRLTSKRPHGQHIAIVGGGPSLRRDIGLLKAYKQAGCEIWALNGAHNWLRSIDVESNAVVLLDARQENVQFLGGAGEQTFYIASQAHADVYDALADRSVIRFDLNNLGDCGTTVGTHALCIAFVEGFRNIHLFGFDSSYQDDAGHAYPQALNDGERILDVTVDEGKSFKAAPWMAQQVKDFLSLAPDLITNGAQITVHGSGMLPYVARRMSETAPVMACDERASEILKRLEGVHNPLGAEIGVFAGDTSSRLLGARSDLRLLMVDSWEADGKAYEGDSGDWHAGLTQNDQDAYYKRAQDIVGFAGSRATIFRCRSVEGAQSAPPLDFAFIDADHSYEGCKRDIEAWWPKIKSGGFISGHDYENTDFPKFGVTRAVDEFVLSMGGSLELGENFTWFMEKK